MIKKLFLIIPTLAFLLFGLVSPAFAELSGSGTYTRGDYNWTSSTTIQSRDFGTFRRTTQENTFIGWTKNLNSRDWIFFVSKWETASRDIYIGVNKSNYSDGRLIKDSKLLPDEWEKITVSDPDGVAPKNQVKVSVGAIWGKVVAGENVPEEVDFSKEVNGKTLELKTDEGTLISNRKIGADGVFDRYSLNAPDQFLYTGHYRLYFHTSQQGNCETGGTDGAGVCRIAFTGVFNFTIEDAGGGKGRVIPVNEDADEQKSLNGDRGVLTTAMNTQPLIKMTVEHSLSNPVESVLVSALEILNKSMASGIEMMMGWVDSILKKGNSLDDKRLENAWKTVRNLALGLLTLGIIIIAFANIVGGVSLEVYGLNKMIPRLVMGVVMTYFSFLIARVLLEVASALQTALVNSAGTSAFMPELNLEGWDNAFATYGEIIFSLYMFAIFLIILFVAVLWLCLVLLVRVAVIWFLVAVAPLAFLMQVLPFTETLYKQWWQRWWKWVFMGPAIAFMLWLTSALMQSYMSGIGTEDGIGITPLVLMAACVFIAASLPMTMGKEVFSGIQNAWKKYGGHLNKVPGVREAKETIGQAKIKRDEYRNAITKRRASKAVDKIGEKFGRPGKVFTGKSGVFGTDADAATAAASKIVTDLPEEVLQARLKSLGGKEADLTSPEVIALLKRISKDIHTAAMNDDTKELVARAFVTSESLKEAQKTDETVKNPYATISSNVMAGNPNKDAVTALYAHANKEGYFDGTEKGMQVMEERALGKVAGKHVHEHSKDDVKALEAGVKRGIEDALKVDKDLRDTFNDSQARDRYIGTASTITKEAHKEYFASNPPSGTSSASSSAPATRSTGGPQGPSSGSGDQWHL